MNIKKTAVKSALAVAAAAAALTTNVSAKDFSGAELYTLEEVQYGKFEARMKMAAASGTVSSMFLYQNGSEIADGRPWVEVDIEVLGKNPGSFQSNIITGKAGAQKTSEKHHAVSPAADQAFHTYGLEWTPNYVRWTVDGQEVRKTEGGQVSNLTGTQGLRFNLWSSESAAWVGQFDESKLPLFQFINWVKVYKYTPGQGEGGSDFTLDWTDNFDTFDGSRWGKGDWTFEGNRVDLTDKNIYSKDGMLILALTRKGQESINGQVPKDDEPAPQSSSSTPASSSSVPASSSSAFVPPSSSSATNAIHAVRTTSTIAKERRGLVNAKGAKVNPNGHKRYRVNFEY
jgi:beta-glucanase (GH16 family)